MDIRPPGEGAESVELEPEESLDPEACFTEGVCVWCAGIPYIKGTKWIVILEFLDFFGLNILWSP